jgi:hypothetical protein
MLYKKEHKGKEHKDKQKNFEYRVTGDTTKAFNATEDAKANWRNRKRQHSEGKDAPENKAEGPCVNCGHKRPGTCNKDPTTVVEAVLSEPTECAEKTG